MVYLPTFTIKTLTNHVGKYTSPMNPWLAMVKNKWSNHETLRTTTFVVDSDFYALLSPRQVSWKSRKLRVLLGKNIFLWERNKEDVGELRESDLKGYIYIYIYDYQLSYIHIYIYIIYYYESFLRLINMYFLLYHMQYIILYCICRHTAWNNIK